LLLLSSANTYSGTTTVSAGVLALSSTAALPGFGTAGRWSVAAGAGLTVGVNGLTNAQADALVTSATATGNLASGAAIGFDTTGAGTYTYANNLPVSAGSGLGLAKSGSGIKKPRQEIFLNLAEAVELFSGLAAFTEIFFSRYESIHGLNHNHTSIGYKASKSGQQIKFRFYFF
jgi:autotransporter-associated beta strand protein